MTTRTKQSAAAKAKKEAQAKAEATEAKPVVEAPTTADAVAPNAEQEAQANAEAATTAEANEANAEPVPETAANAVAPNPEPAAAPQPTEIQGNTVTGDGTGNALPPMFELPGVFVRTKRRIKSRRRAGFRFNRNGMGIALEALSEEQLKQLREDPALEVEDCTFPLDEATSEPEA